MTSQHVKEQIFSNSFTRQNSVTRDLEQTFVPRARIRIVEIVFCPQNGAQRGKKNHQKLERHHPSSKQFPSPLRNDSNFSSSDQCLIDNVRSKGESSSPSSKEGSKRHCRSEIVSTDLYCSIFYILSSVILLFMVSSLLRGVLRNPREISQENPKGIFQGKWRLRDRIQHDKDRTVTTIVVEPFRDYHEHFIDPIYIPRDLFRSILFHLSIHRFLIVRSGDE